jgi:two-component system cell cycle sensor histidine kinase/response regulator CckA
MASVTPSLDATRRALAASEARYRRLMELSPLATFVYERDSLRFLFGNAAATALYGWSAEELARMTLRDLRPPEFLPELQRILQARGPEPRKVGMATHHRKDGTRLRVEVYAHDIDWEGKRGRVIVVVDLTARTQMEEELREAKRDLEAAQAAGQVGTWLWQVGGEARWSPETYRIYGLEPGTRITADRYSAVIHPDDVAGWRSAVDRATAEGVRYDHEHRIIRADGSVRWVHGMATVERAAEGRGPRLIGTVQDVTDRRSAEEERDRFFSLAYDIFCVARGDRFVRVNQAFARALGYSEAELMARPAIDFVHVEDIEITRQHAAKLYADQPMARLINRFMAKDGSVRWLEWNAVRPKDSGLVYASARDITEQRALQDRLAQSQKLEAIGQLAGGIAHDYNNILSVIRGGAELLRADLRPDDPLYTDAGEIIAAAERAATLTRQLLAFSRKQVLQPVVLDVNELVTSTGKLLRRLIGEQIELVLKLGEPPLRTRADLGQMGQVLINLAVNARDAMPRGGRLCMETALVTLGADDGQAQLGLEAGRYVLIAVSDAGAGMSPDVQKRVFEPFFTTKEVGRGTGLGLATAYGIIKQSGGNIWVYSEAGVGTTFKIYLPLTDDPTVEDTLAARSPARGNGETILLVEDEPMVRHLVHRVLQRSGFEVLEASNGGDALMMAEQHRRPIDLLLTDIIMPRMSGRQLAERLVAWHPNVRVVYMSGYTEDVVVSNGTLDQQADFVPKPIAPADLVHKIREVLDRVDRRD